MSDVDTAAKELLVPYQTALMGTATTQRSARDFVESHMLDYDVAMREQVSDALHALAEREA